MTLLYVAAFLMAIMFMLAFGLLLGVILLSAEPDARPRIQVEDPRDRAPLDIAPAIARERKTRVTTIPKEHR